MDERTNPLHVATEKTPASWAGRRVLQVIDADVMGYPPTINAARVLAAAGAEVVCVSGMRTNPPVSMPEGVSVRYETFGSWEDRGVRRLHWGLGRYAFRAAVMRAAAALRPDLVIAYDTGAAWAALPLTRGSRACPAVLHVHDNEDRERMRWRSLRAWQWHVVRHQIGRFRGIVVPEELRAAHLRAAWGIEGPFFVVANAPPRVLPVRNDLLREQLGLAQDARIAVLVGRMGMLHDAARALASAPGWHLVVVGTERGEAQRLRGFAEEIGMARHVHVIPYTDYDTMRLWLPGCDVGLALYPSSSMSVNWRFMGTASIKIMEYMAAGLPSIVCAQPSMDALVRETDALEVLEEESAQGIARALARLTGPELARRRSRAALAAHLSRYNMEAQLASLGEALALTALRVSNG